MKRERVVVGMSGGVDSSVAAALLIEQGYDVVGLFMNNWDERDESGCCTSAEDWQDALAVAGKLGIPCYSVDFSRQYLDRVFSYFLDEYRRGRTPNPDVMCNREIKFAPFREYAAGLGASLIATGHYCAAGVREGKPVLLKPADADKDQTYFLNQVRTDQLKGVIFPLAGLRKAEVRAIAERLGLVTARKKDSTGICFIGERRFRKFLAEYLPASPGNIVDVSGRVVGRHDGLMYYTLGQRRGLGIGGVAGERQERWYVVDKRLDTNELVVSCGEGEELLSRGCVASALNIIGPVDFPTELACRAKLRYRQGEQDVLARFDFEHSSLELSFASRQRAVTPGQYAVLYLGERCLGGAIIDEVIK